MRMAQKNIRLTRFDDLRIIPIVLDDLEVLSQPLSHVTADGVRTGD